MGMAFLLSYTWHPLPAISVEHTAVGPAVWERCLIFSVCQSLMLLLLSYQINFRSVFFYFVSILHIFRNGCTLKIMQIFTLKVVSLFCDITEKEGIYH